MNLSTRRHLESILPHRGRMLMLSEIVSHDSDKVHCTSIIDPDNPLVTMGCFPATGGMELLAQAAGILFAAHNPDNAAQPGAVIQVKYFRAEHIDIPAGAELHIHAGYIAGSSDAALFDGRVLFNNRAFFTGTLMIALLPGESA